jgi:WD40 repeat protein
VNVTRAIARWAKTALVAVLSFSPVTAQTLPPQEPQLRIDAGMHTAPINRIGVDVGCTLLASGSDDKSVRLWRLPEGRLLKTLRPPISPGDVGKVYAVAVAPDGSWVAAGGWLSRDGAEYANIFEVATGGVVARLGPLGDEISHLAVSPDGRFLAATLGGGDGLRVWQRIGSDLATWRLVAEDKNYGGKSSSGASFDRTGRLYTVADDGRLRSYAVGYTAKPASIVTRGGKLPLSVAVHPSGDRVAVGFRDTAAVDVYDAIKLSWRFAADSKGVDNGSLSSVAWSVDGRLFAGGRYDKGGHSMVRVWQQAGRGPIQELAGPLDTIGHLLPCGDGIAIGAYDPAFGVFGPNGRRLLWRESVKADLRNKLFEHFTASRDGRRLRFGLKLSSGDPVLFNIDAERLSDAPSAIRDLYSADTKSLVITDWDNSQHPKLAGKLINLRVNEWVKSLAIAPDKRSFILGTEWTLRAYGEDGKARWEKPVPDTVWGVNIPRDGKMVIAAYGDGTLRWHRLSDGQELLALFMDAKDRRWVVWTPKGYYTASTGGEELIGWLVNRGWSEAADFFPASQFRDQFNRPDIVHKVLATLDEDKAINAANDAARRERAKEDLRKRLPPVVAILSPTEGATLSSSDLTLEYSVRSPSGIPVTIVRALIDGRPVEGAQTKGFVPVGSSETKGSFRLTGLPASNVNISVIAETGDMTSAPATVVLVWKGAPPLKDEDLRKGKLYALLVGVGTYTDPHIKRLSWAAQDARDMKSSLEVQKGKLYRDVEVRLLIETQATRKAVIDGLEWLKHNVLKGDVGLLFLSGHGATDDRAGYFFVPHDAELDPDAGMFLPKRSSAVPSSEILEALKAVRGHALFFFDTCHAGSAAGLRLKGDLDFRKAIAELASAQVGAFVLASSDGGQLSQERDEWKNGAFTKAMKEGLAGKADYTNDGIVTLDELSLYVKERVKELTGGLQMPVDLRPQETQNIPLAAVR